MGRKKQFPWTKYIFHWEDPTGDSAWLTSNDMDKLSPAIITTEAYLYSKDKKYIKTFASYIKEEDGSYTFGDVNCFLASGLVKMLKI